MATDIDHSARGAGMLFIDHAAAQDDRSYKSPMSYVELRLRPFTGETGMEQTIRMEIPGQPVTDFWKEADYIIHSLYVHRDTVDKTDLYIEIVNSEMYHPGYECHGGHNPTELANWGVTVTEAIETTLRHVGPGYFSEDTEMDLRNVADLPHHNGYVLTDHAAKAAGWTQVRWEDAAYGLS